MEIIVLASLLLSVMVTAGVFVFAKSIWRLHAIFNVIGALFVFFACVSSTAWLMGQMGLFENQTKYPPFPVVPWYNGFIFLSIAWAWYAIATALRGCWIDAWSGK